ncbi:hypothetical protein GGS20DRAFT_590831 [Poronia punctata]|nr:hypothetical protein GGS20DRAFT_590831 [Poronia punctata]
MSRGHIISNPILIDDELDDVFVLSSDSDLDLDLDDMAPRTRRKEDTGTKPRSPRAIAPKTTTNAAFSTVEPTVSASSPMPPKYKFVPKGNPYVTRHCRQRTQAARQVVYVVVDKRRKPIGIRVPQSIYVAVIESEKETHSEREQAVTQRDEALKKRFSEEILARFPCMPSEEVPKIINRAMKKHAGRVGRTGTMELSEKAFLAVQAHVRHTKTDYDKLLKDGTQYEAARSLILPKVREVLVQWGLKDLKPMNNAKITQTKTTLTVKKTASTQPLMKAAANQKTTKKNTIEAITSSVTTENIEETTLERQKGAGIWTRTRSHSFGNSGEVENISGPPKKRKEVYSGANKSKNHEERRKRRKRYARRSEPRAAKRPGGRAVT